jgi:hypothetical protein
MTELEKQIRDKFSMGIAPLSDSESIFKYVKDLINQIEDFMASADGQQLNFNLSVLKEISEDVLE